MPKTASKAEALEALTAARAELAEATDEIEDARDAQGKAAVAAKEAGATYTEIGEALGLSKQRAFDLVKAAESGA